MGLKESGLRGSLRNTSSVLPAFFDVTITNTNSPVQEGDILTVDYSADNTGDAQDMQDIRLEIDSVQEDVDPDVMLAGGASTTGTLEWDTTDEDEAEYTATVLSDDDSDSVIVEIGSAIPDTAIYQLTVDGFNAPQTWSEEIEEISVTFEDDFETTTLSDGSTGVRPADGNSAARLPIAPPNDPDVYPNGKSWEVELETTETSGYIEGVDYDGPDTIAALILDDGQPRAVVRDASGNLLDITHPTDISDGSLHKVSAIFNDISNNNLELIVDGVSETETGLNQNPDPNDLDSDGDFGLHGRWRPDTNSWDDRLDASVKIWRWHDSAIDEQTI